MILNNILIIISNICHFIKTTELKNNFLINKDIIATPINIKLYPRPFPRPSKKLNKGFSFIAKASALPITMQFVIINPTKTDNFLLVS